MITREEAAHVKVGDEIFTWRRGTKIVAVVEAVGYYCPVAGLAGCIKGRLPEPAPDAYSDAGYFLQHEVLVQPGTNQGCSWYATEAGFADDYLA